MVANVQIANIVNMVHCDSDACILIKVQYLVNLVKWLAKNKKNNRNCKNIGFVRYKKRPILKWDRSLSLIV